MHIFGTWQCQVGPDWSGELWLKTLVKLTTVLSIFLPFSATVRGPPLSPWQVSVPWEMDSDMRINQHHQQKTPSFTIELTSSIISTSMIWQSRLSPGAQLALGGCGLQVAVTLLISRAQHLSGEQLWIMDRAGNQCSKLLCTLTSTISCHVEFVHWMTTLTRFPSLFKIAPGQSWKLHLDKTLLELALLRLLGTISWCVGNGASPP